MRGDDLRLRGACGNIVQLTVRQIGDDGAKIGSGQSLEHQPRPLCLHVRGQDRRQRHSARLKQLGQVQRPSHFRPGGGVSDAHNDRWTTVERDIEDVVSRSSLEPLRGCGGATGHTRRDRCGERPVRFFG
jgi:hypothetical protein